MADLSCFAILTPPRRSYNLLLGTFRSPYLFTFSFDTKTGKLELQHANEAVGGHSWLDVSPDGKTLYTTCWTTPPVVASYDILPPSSDKSFPTVKLSAKIPSKHLSGYVCSNSKAMYSACGPQVDVFLLDEKTGALKEQEAVQSFALVDPEAMHKGNSQMDFGGLRHGGHVGCKFPAQQYIKARANWCLPPQIVELRFITRWNKALRR